MKPNRPSMANPFEKKLSDAASPKMTHISARLTSEQMRAFRQFGVRNGKTAQQIIMEALSAIVPEFPA